MSAAEEPRAAAAHAALMDGVYRHQRHIYDATRKYYLLGRDDMIRELDAASGDSVLELGCGTGRNLVMIGKRYPDCRLFGLDISEEMLINARLTLGRRGNSPATLIQGDARMLDAYAQFGESGFDHIVLSYALSMIPPWRETLTAAIANLKPTGRLHVVDFGTREKLPAWFGGLLDAWLARFHVKPRVELDAVAARLAARADRGYVYRSLYGGYAQLLRVQALRRP